MKNPGWLQTLHLSINLGEAHNELEISHCPGLKHWETMQSSRHNLKPVTKTFNIFHQSFHAFCVIAA